MAALAEVGQEISATLEVRAILDRIGERVQTLLAADSVALFLAEPDGKTFRPILALGSMAEAVLADTIMEGEGIVGDVIRRRTPEYVNDTTTDSRTVAIPSVAGSARWKGVYRLPENPKDIELLGGNVPLIKDLVYSFRQPVIGINEVDSRLLIFVPEFALVYFFFKSHVRLSFYPGNSV